MFHRVILLLLVSAASNNTLYCFTRKKMAVLDFVFQAEIVKSAWLNLLNDS